jgi:hypothetical protein
LFSSIISSTADKTLEYCCVCVRPNIGSSIMSCVSMCSMCWLVLPGRAVSRTPTHLDTYVCVEGGKGEGDFASPLRLVWPSATA